MDDAVGLLFRHSMEDMEWGVGLALAWVGLWVPLYTTSQDTAQSRMYKITTIALARLFQSNGVYISLKALQSESVSVAKGEESVECEDTESRWQWLLASDGARNRRASEEERRQ